MRQVQRQKANHLHQVQRDGQRKLMTLKWMGNQVRSDVIAAIIDGVTEFGLTHETEAKRELTPGHGLLTGTLRRSIHAAGPDYPFAGDDVKPKQGSPDRSGQGMDIKEKNGRVAVTVGSGMIYARKIEELYGYISGSHRRVIGRLEGIIKKHARARGLK